MKLLSLLSGGIDSPVATYLMLKKGYDVELVHLNLKPFGRATALNKIKKLASKLEELHGSKIKLHILPHGKYLAKVMDKAENHKLLCVLCRRKMLKEASKLAKKVGADGLITGDNLAQVASQTLDNLYVEERASKLAIIRPLIGVNKEEIIKIARKIGTYPISTEPGGCCNMVPKYPATHADLERVEQEEKRIK